MRDGSFGARDAPDGKARRLEMGLDVRSGAVRFAAHRETWRSGIRNDGGGTRCSGNRLRASDGGEDQTIRKANGNRSHRQEERNSRVVDIGTGVTGASWAAFYVTKGLDMTSGGKKEAQSAVAKAAQGKA